MAKKTGELVREEGKRGGRKEAEGKVEWSPEG